MEHNFGQDLGGLQQGTVKNAGWPPKKYHSIPPAGKERKMK
jgi:hypothetical protein